MREFIDCHEILKFKFSSNLKDFRLNFAKKPMQRIQFICFIYAALDHKAGATMKF